MAKLIFKVSSDVDKVIKLREEIVKLKQEISTMSKGDASKTQKRINQATKEITSLVTEAAKAGQVFENDLKKKIFDSSKTVNVLSAKIIEQKSIVKDVTADVRNLAEAYRNMSDININKGHTLKELQAARKALDEEKASLFGLQQEQAKARLSVKELKDEYSLLKDESKQVVNVNQGLVFSWKKMVGIIGGAAALKKLSSDIVNVRGDMEALGNSFEVLLGSRKKAEGFVSEIIQYAVDTPFSTSNISGAAQTLLGFNVEAEKVMPTLKQIGDISMGNAQRFDSLSLAFAQMSAAGRLLGQDLNQMINAGFNPLQVISEQTGKSIADLKSEMEKGGISSEMVAKAFEDATAEGGKFHGMLSKNADSINTIKNQLSGAFEEMYNNLGKKGEGVIKYSYKAGIALVKNYETVGKVLASSVAVLGTYKTALMLNELWERRLIITRALAIKKQIALNAVMNANPYTLLATTIVGLAGAVWTLSDSTSAAERAQKKFNKEKEDVIAREQEHKSKIESLIQITNDATLADEERSGALSNLIDMYPEIIQKYIDEEGHLINILKLKKEIANIQTLESKEKQENDLKDLDSLITQKEKELKTELSNTPNSQKRWVIEKELKELRADRDVLQKEITNEQEKEAFKNWQVGLKKLTDKQIQTQIEENRRRIKETEDQPLQDSLDKEYKVLEAELESRGGSSNYKKDKEKARKEWEDAKKELEKIQKDKDNFSSKQYLEAKKNVESKESIYKNLGGITDSPKSLKAEKGQPQEIQSQVRDQKKLEFQVIQARIDAMKEGNEKIIAQIDLNHKKELQTLEWNREDYLKKKIAIEKSIFETDEKNKGRMFDSSLVTLNAGEVGMFDSLKTGVDKKYSNQLSAIYTDLLTKYQGYTEKRLEVQKKFQIDRENLIKAGASQETLDENSYQEKNALEAIDSEFAMRENSFQSWVDSIVNMSLEKLKELLAEAQEELERMEQETPNDPKLAAQRAKVNTLSKTVETVESKGPDKRSVKAWGDLYKVLGKVDKQFEEIGDTIGGTVGDIIKSAGGIASATLQMVDGIKTLANSSAQAMDGTSKAAEKSITSVEKASVVLAIVGAALQVATKIADLLGGNDREKYEKAKENYESYVQVLDKIIDKQKELIETMTGDAAVKASERAIELTKKQMDATRALASDWLSSKKGSTFSGGNWRGADKVLKNYRKELKNLGYDITSVQNQLINLSPEDLRKIREELPKMWADFGDELSGSLDTIIDLEDKIEEIGLRLQEGLTQVSFDDIYSNFLDVLMDMDSSNEDLADNFEKYMQKAILNSMLLDNYKEKIKGWYAAFAKANEDDAGITKDEYDKLQEDWSSIVTDALKERDRLKELFDWKSEEEKQSSSKGGFTAMSQDSADELNGRFTYNNVVLEQLRGEALSQSEALNYLRANLGEVLLTTKDTRNIADEIRTIQVNSYLELQGIRENTGSIIKPIKQMASDIQEVKRNTSKL